MKTKQLTEMIRNIVSNEIRNTIIKESEDTQLEKFAIKCEGVPLGYFDTKEEAESAMEKMKDKKGDLIIEKESFENFEEMMNTLDEMNDQLEEDTEECNECGNQSMEESNDVDENAFVLAADAARDAGEKEFEFPKGSGKMHKVTIKKDIPEEIEETEKQVCKECGSPLNEGMCNECGWSMNESKKKVLRLKESEMIEVIKKIIKESHPGLKITNNVKKISGQINKESNTATGKSIGKFLELAEDEEFPIQSKESELDKKVINKVNNTPKQDEEVDSNKRGMENLQYEIEPSEAFKKRLKMALEGDTLMGNSQEAANVVKTKTGEDKLKSAKRKEKEAKKEPLYKKEPVPVTVKKDLNENKVSLSDVLSEEIKKMKHIGLYNKKTQ